MTTAEKDLALVRRIAALLEIPIETEPRTQLIMGASGKTVLTFFVRTDNGLPFWPLTDDAQCFTAQMRMRQSGVVMVGRKGVTWSTKNKETYIALLNATDAACRHGILECFVKGIEP